MLFFWCAVTLLTWHERAGTPLFFVWNERSHRFVWWHERAHRFLWHERAHRFVWTQACSKQDCGQFFDLHAALDLIRNHFVDFCTQGQHFVEQRRVEVLQAREDILDDLDVFFWRHGACMGSFSSATEMGLQGPQAGMPFHRHQCRAQKFHPACIESLLSAPTGLLRHSVCGVRPSSVQTERQNSRHASKRSCFSGGQASTSAAIWHANKKSASSMALFATQLLSFYVWDTNVLQVLTISRISRSFYSHGDTRASKWDPSELVITAFFFSASTWYTSCRWRTGTM